MHSLTFVLLTFAALAFSQTIDPNTVDLKTRQTWCTDQIASCPLICLQTPGNSGGTIQNTCDPNTLTYVCVCSNGLSPNLTEYSLTIPYFECTTFVTQCVKACPQGDNACSHACTTNYLCGAQNPTRVNVTSTSTTMSATPTGTAATAATGTNNIYTGFGGQPTATASAGGSGSGSGSGTSGATQLALQLGQAYGLGLVLFGVAAGFTIFM